MKEKPELSPLWLLPLGAILVAVIAAWVIVVSVLTFWLARIGGMIWERLF